MSTPAEALVDRLRDEGERVERVAGGWVTTCPCCGEADALLIRDEGAPDPDEVFS